MTSIVDIVDAIIKEITEIVFLMPDSLALVTLIEIKERVGQMIDEYEQSGTELP